MHKHFHTEKSGETFLLLNIKILCASRAYKGKYLSQNVPLPKQNEHSQKVCGVFLFCKICKILQKWISEGYFIQ